MPKLKHAAPKYRRHKSSGLAVVTLDGRDYYLGKYNSAASRSEFDRLVGEWMRNGRQLLSQNDLALVELGSAYKKFAKQYYRKSGEPTREAYMVVEVVKFACKTHGRISAVDFGPKSLKAIRDRMIEEVDWSRGYINKQVDRLRRMFRWAASEELTPVSVYEALRTVPGLRKGRSSARETEPIRPVDDDTIEMTIKQMPAVVADMVRLQRLCGARPTEICLLRPCDVERSEEVWRYVPASHKTEHQNRQRVIFIGPRAQEILRPYLLRGEHVYCFSPTESERKRRDAQHANRKTPLNCGHRPGTNRKRRPKRKSGKRYTNGSYRRAIHRACDKAFPVPTEIAKDPEAGIKYQKSHRWSPNRLRHTCGTEVRRRFGLESAQCVLGHAQANVSEIYCERDLSKALEVMRDVG